MLRAFECLSRNLNLSKTCEEIGATRQTVRRHITDLEAILGYKLFVVEDRRYQLTLNGETALEGAKAIIRQIDNWSGTSDLRSGYTDGLERMQYTDDDGRTFYSQQHPISRIATKGLPLMRHALQAWGASCASIEHEAMQDIRPYLVLFRKGQNGWVFVDIGNESAYAKWFGWAWSKSAIGKLNSEDNVGDDYNEFVSGAYARIYNEGGVRLDDIYAYLPKEGEDPAPVTFQRLLLGCSFPDGTSGLIVLAAVTGQVEIEALNPANMPDLPSDLLADGLLNLSSI